MAKQQGVGRKELTNDADRDQAMVQEEELSSKEARAFQRERE